MTEPRDEAEGWALWRWWRGRNAQLAVPMDGLSLAAYAEGRLDANGAQAVEYWLAAHPEALADVIAARAAAEAPSSSTSAAIVARAAGLVHWPSAEVVPLRRAAPRWRTAVAWSGIAASLMVTSLVGFALGSDAYLSAANTSAADTTFQNLLDPPTGLFSGFGEDNGT
jgi:anti-sigma factor RsiW